MNDQHSNNRELIAVRIRAPKSDGSPYGSPLWVPSPCRSSLLRTSRPTTGRKLASGRRDGKGGLSPRTVRHHHVTVGNQQKWDTFVKERSGGCGSVAGLPALPVVALTPL